MKKKKCPKCKKTKPLSSEYFYRNKNKSSGFDSWCKECEKKRYQKRMYRLWYGLSMDAYKQVSRHQKGRCAICGRLEKSSPRGKLFVDHCHKRKIVRGLLCLSCNSLIGYAKDDVELLKSAIRYLTVKPPAIEK